MSTYYEQSRPHLPPPPPRHPRPRPRSRPKTLHIQESFLFESLRESHPVVVALLSGDLIQGRIRRFDPYAVVIDDGAEERLLYKHAIACIARASA
ncbi:MAG: hypothetical protein GY719_31530 [bacterium]|nr:hypothetical protein [bacterium]